MLLLLEEEISFFKNKIPFIRMFKAKAICWQYFFYQNSKLQRIFRLTTETTTYKDWLRTLEMIPPLEGPTQIYNDVIKIKKKNMMVETGLMSPMVGQERALLHIVIKFTVL